MKEVWFIWNISGWKDKSYMYNIKSTTREYRNSPWNRPYQDRIEVLQNAKKIGKRTIAFLYPFFDSSTFRYRGYNVAETLEYSLRFSTMYFEMTEIEELEQSISDIDVLVIIRCAWDLEMDDFIEKVKAHGTKVVYDVDDLIYNPKYMPIVIKTLGLEQHAEWDYWFSLTQRNHMIAEKCDAFITTNGYLAEYLENDYGKPCHIIQNYLNWIQEEVSKEYFEQKQTMKSDGQFEIGYFSGSPTHVKDLMIVMPEIEEFLNTHEDAILKIVGYMELPEEYTYLVEQDRIQYVPFQTFVGLQQEQAKVDINIVPLVNNQFSNCKSELKYFETAIVGTITCATPTYTYANAITHGENGYLCEKGEWLPIFEKVYAEGVSPEKQAHICQRALDEYGHKNQLHHVEDVFESIYGNR